MNSPIILAEHLVKWYGPRLAVRDISFTVEPGEVVGLLGPNGSGKSTIFRILTGYLTPSSGTVTVAGHDTATDSLALRQEVGYVPENAPLYDHMRVGEFLRFMARLKGLAGREVRRAVDGVIARLQLEQVERLPAGKLSRGFRQRVAIAQALLRAPRLLVLDEPTSGLDPSQVIAVRELIRELAGKQTVLIASHVLSEMEHIASRVMILLDGKLLTDDALGRSAAMEHLSLAVEGPEAEIRSAVDAVAGVRSITLQPNGTEDTARYIVEAAPRPRLAQDIAAALAAHNLALAELIAIPPDLEQVFLELTRRPKEAAA